MIQNISSGLKSFERKALTVIVSFVAKSTSTPGWILVRVTCLQRFSQLPFMPNWKYAKQFKRDGSRFGSITMSSLQNGQRIPVCNCHRYLSIVSTRFTCSICLCPHLRNVIRIYTTTAIILLNTLVLFVILNLLLGAVYFVSDRYQASVKRNQTGLFAADGAPLDNGERSEYALECFDYNATKEVSPTFAEEVLSDFYA